VAQVTGVAISMMSWHWCCRMEKEWKNGGVSGVEESTECRRDWICLLRQLIAIVGLSARTGDLEAMWYFSKDQVIT